MKPELRRKILEDGGRSGARRLARELGLSRTDVEAVLAEARVTEEAQRGRERPAPVRERWLAVGLFFASLAVRLCYVAALKDSPFFGPLSDKLDDGVYDQMAQSISGGNWAAYFPEGAYRIPGYPYFLGFLYFLFGRSLMAVHLTQALLGALVPVLVYGLTRRLFGSWSSALAAGVLAAVYVPLIFFENLLLGESLSVFLNTAAWLVMAGCWNGARRRVWPFVPAGLLLGLSCLLRPNTMMAVAVCALFIAAHAWSGNRRKEALTRALLLAGCVAAVIAPITVKNAVLYRDFIPITAIGGVNLYIGNNPEADGRFRMTPEIGSALAGMIRQSQAVAERHEGRALRPSEVSRYWSRRAAAFWAEDPVRAARLFALKAALFVNQYEYPDILGIDFAAQLVPLLALRPVNHGFLVVFASLGVWWVGRRFIRDGLTGSYAAFTAGYAASILLFFLTARYRVPASALLIPVAGHGLAALLRAVGRLDVSRLRGATAVGLAALAAAYWPVSRTTYAGNFNSLGVYYRVQGAYDKAEACYRRAIELEPDYSSPYHNLAILLDKTGRPAEAAAAERKYLELSGKV